MTKLYIIIICAICFVGGWYGRAVTHTCPVTEVIKPVIKTQTETVIEYVPKIVYVDGTREKTDVDMNVGKQELSIKVNGKDFEFQKADDEKFVFDKNKLQFSQSSRAELNINVPVIDETRRWQIGVGISKDGAVGMVGFPLKKNIGGWIAGRKNDVMIGVNISM